MLHILGAGSFHPQTEIPNAFLEDLGIESSAEWIIDKIGIEVRRSVLPLDYIKSTKNSEPYRAFEVASETPGDMALAAAEGALRMAGIDAEQVGLILCNTCTPTSFAPTEGQLLAQRLGIEVPAYEVFTACPVFALHMHYLENFREDQLPDYILCVSSAAYTTAVDYNDRSDSAIWGDGAAAWVVSPRVPGRLALLGTRFASDTTRAPAVVVTTFGHFHQDGRAVRDFSVRQTVRLLKAVEQEYGVDWKRDIFIGHQANRTMLDQVCTNRSIPPENHWFNVTFYGNQAGAGAPAVLAEHWDRLQPGQKIVAAVIGAGLSWGFAVLEVSR